jgi:hypothetical protein
MIVCVLAYGNVSFGLDNKDKLMTAERFGGGVKIEARTTEGEPCAAASKERFRGQILSREG